MLTHGNRCSTLFLSLVLAACNSSTSEAIEEADASPPADAGFEDQVEVLETFDIGSFNAELVDGRKTADMAFYITEDGPLSWADLATNVSRAQRIFEAAGVQLRVSSAMRISIPDAWQRLEADDIEVPQSPELLETDLYAHLDELATRLNRRNQGIFEAITYHFPAQDHGVSSANTIHVITLDEAPISFYEWDGTNWNFATAPTGGLSFPPYAYADRIPLPLRGVITLSFEQDRFRPESRVLAHEVGHKIINVSHEGTGVCPAFAVDGPDLMLYGDGETIPEGEAGRFQRERLARSPFLYTLEGGTANFEPIYQDGGIYSDRVYENFVVDPVCEIP